MVMLDAILETFAAQDASAKLAQRSYKEEDPAVGSRYVAKEVNVYRPDAGTFVAI